MERDKLNQMSHLFEKAVAAKITGAEFNELTCLYQDYINDGRDFVKLNHTQNSSDNASISLVG